MTTLTTPEERNPRMTSTTKRMKKGQRHQLNADSVHVTTWLDRPGELHTFKLQSSPTGLRVIVHIWHDDNSAYVRKIKGDGRTTDFREFSRVDLSDPTTDEIIAAVEGAR